jgi:serine/threonine protein phosphatase PrpC
LGSDGLFDNLYDDEILEEVKKLIDQTDLDPMTIPQLISEALVQRAKIVSEDPDNPTSPFQVKAMHEGLYYQVRTLYSIQ